MSNKKNETTFLVDVGTWEVSMSPAKPWTRVAGMEIPHPGFFLRRARKLQLAIQSSSDSRDNSNDDLQEDDRIVLRVLEQEDDEEEEEERRNNNNNNNNNSNNNNNHEKKDKERSRNNNKEEVEGWMEKYCFALANVTLVSRKEEKMTLHVRSKDERRDVVFASSQDAEAFQQQWQELLNQVERRAIREVKEYQRSLSKKQDESGKDGGTTNNQIAAKEFVHDQSAHAVVQDDQVLLQLLMEIVSASNLPVADALQGSADPYVVVQWQDRELHRTDRISNNHKHPIWTIQSQSLFLFEMNAQDFFRGDSLTFLVKDHDTLGPDDTLGSVEVPRKELLTGTGDRQEYTLHLAPKFANKQQSSGDGDSKLVLRYKQASDDDIQFMKAYRRRNGESGLYSQEVYLPIQKPVSTTLTKLQKHGDNGETLKRVLPGPDPDKEETATWKTTEKLHQEALKPSTNWVQAGSGDLGMLYLEIIGCDNLPNLDTFVPGAFGTSVFPNAPDAIVPSKTDAFACVVYEDSVVHTDVIPDSLSPRWMPWTYRAFAFQMAHPSNDVFLGIFDHDKAMDPTQIVSRAAHLANLHDAAGRVVIELSSLQPDTTYVLKYPLYHGETEAAREKSRGTVTVRLRMEFNSLRKTMLSALTLPKNNVVALKKSSEYAVAHYTVEGKVDDEEFSIGTLTRHVEELRGYLDLLQTIKAALLFVCLWRSHYKVSMFGYSCKLPLHSITAYIWGIQVAWNYDLLPSFLCFCIGWAMLACHEHVNRHPSPWHKAPSYFDLLRRLIFNSSRPERIEAGANKSVVEKYEKTMQEQKERNIRERRREQARKQEIEKEVKERMKDAEKAEKAGFSSGGSLLSSASPLKPILYPYQKMLGGYVQKARLAQNIVLWYESYLTFWMTTFAFLLSTAVYFVPWGFVLRWTIRFSVVVLLGPWMKLVDILILRTDPNMSLKEQEEAFKKRMEERSEKALKSTQFYQIRQERAKKLNHMRQYLFGQHLLQVPVLHRDKFLDYPLPDSLADPARDHHQVVEPTERKFGQTLEGDMIPQRELQIHQLPVSGHGIKFGNPLKLGQNAVGFARDVATEGPMKVGAGVLKAGSFAWKTGKKVGDNVPLLRGSHSTGS